MHLQVDKELYDKVTAYGLAKCFGESASTPEDSVSSPRNSDADKM